MAANFLEKYGEEDSAFILWLYHIKNDEAAKMKAEGAKQLWDAMQLSQQQQGVLHGRDVKLQKTNGLKWEVKAVFHAHTRESYMAHHNGYSPEQAGHGVSGCLMPNPWTEKPFQAFLEQQLPLTFVASREVKQEKLEDQYTRLWQGQEDVVFPAVCADVMAEGEVGGHLRLCKQRNLTWAKKLPELEKNNVVPISQAHLTLGLPKKGAGNAAASSAAVKRKKDDTKNESLDAITEE